MNYAIMTYDRKKLSLSGRDTQNMGDWIQTIAMETLYSEWGITNYSYVSRNDANSYDGEYVVLPINCFNRLYNCASYVTKPFPLSPKIIPVFYSFHLHDRNLPLSLMEQLKRFEPIGCRDEETMKNMRANGIKAYLSGCVTALLPQRDKTKKYDKVIAVDIPHDLENYIPERIRENLEKCSALFPITRTTGEPYMTPNESHISYQTAKDRLAYYRDNAALIITSRLHVASPCMAMGIPVILASEDFDGRFSWIDRFLKLYTRDNWSDIDWEPSPIEYEEFKNLQKSYLHRIIKNTYEKNIQQCQISEFLENRTPTNYNRTIQKAIKQLGKIAGKSCRYCLWGVIDKSLPINNMIQDLLPEWELTNVYDAIVEGCFEGKEIKKPQTITSADNDLYIIVAPKAQAEAKKLLESLGGKYVLVDAAKDLWSNNLPMV